MKTERPRPTRGSVPIALLLLVAACGGPAEHDEAATGLASSVAVVPAPAAPSDLTASIGPTGVVLAWTDNSLDETGFSVERCLGAGCTAFGQIATIGADATSYLDTYRASGTSRYRVRAFSGAGYSAYSNSVEILLVSTGDVLASISADPTTGQAPLTVTLGGSSSSAINGTITDWTWSFGDDQTASGEMVTHTYVTPGVYAASLKATATGVFGGSAADSTAVIITVTAPPLAAPTDLSATPVREMIRLTWTNPESSATSRALQRCRGVGCTSFTRIAVLTASATTFTDSDIVRGKTYSYRLAASNGTATVYSNTAVVTALR